MTDRTPLVTFFVVCPAVQCAAFEAALREHHFANEVRHFPEASELLVHLDGVRDNGQGVALLDGAAPGALDELRALKRSRFQHMPVVVVGADDQTHEAYEAGANAVVAREVWEGDIARVTQAVGSFWIRLVKRPPVLR